MRQRGFTLIEVLIALSLFLLLLGNTIHFYRVMLVRQQLVFQQTIALAQLQKLAVFIQIQKDPLLNITEWQAENQSLLPKGQGEINCHLPVCTIRLHWLVHGISVWQCDKPPIPSEACLALKVFLS